MNDNKLNNLVIRAAYYKKLYSELKRKGSAEFQKCKRADIENAIDSCLHNCYREWKAQDVYASFEDYIGFEEWYENELAEGKICEHCQECRELKKQRSIIGKKMGAANAAITKVGLRLINETSKRDLLAIGITGDFDL